MSNKKSEQNDVQVKDLTSDQSDDSGEVTQNNELPKEHDHVAEALELMEQLDIREKALKDAEEKLVAQKLVFEQKNTDVAVIADAPLEGELLPANEQLPLAVILKMDYSFQTGMPSRPELLVTMNYKRGQIVKDPQAIKTLIEVAAPISFE